MINQPIKIFLHRSINSIRNNNISSSCEIMKHSKEHILKSYNDNFISLGFIFRNNIQLKSLWNKDGSIATFVLGNIFNIDEIINSAINKKIINKDDTPKLHSLYKIYRFNKNDFIKKLNGVFVLFFYNKNENNLIIINDKFGYLPIYLYQDYKNFVLSSEIKPITEKKRDPKEH